MTWRGQEGGTGAGTGRLEGGNHTGLVTVLKFVSAPREVRHKGSICGRRNELRAGDPLPPNPTLTTRQVPCLYIYCGTCLFSDVA